MTTTTTTDPWLQGAFLLATCNKKHNCPSTLANYDIDCAKTHCESAIIKLLQGKLIVQHADIKEYNDMLKKGTPDEIKQIKDVLKSTKRKIKNIESLLKSNLKNKKMLLSALTF